MKCSILRNSAISDAPFASLESSILFSCLGSNKIELTATAELIDVQINATCENESTTLEDFLMRKEKVGGSAAYVSLARFCRHNEDWKIWSDVYFCEKGHGVLMQESGSVYTGMFATARAVYDFLVRDGAAFYEKSFNENQTHSEVSNEISYPDGMQSLTDLSVATKEGDVDYYYDDDHDRDRLLKRNDNDGYNDDDELNSILLDLVDETLDLWTMNLGSKAGYCYSSSICKDGDCSYDLPPVILSDTDPRPQCYSDFDSVPTISIRQSLVANKYNVNGLVIELERRLRYMIS